MGRVEETAITLTLDRHKSESSIADSAILTPQEEPLRGSAMRVER